MTVSARPDRLRTIALFNGGLGLIAVGVGSILLAAFTEPRGSLLLVGFVGWMFAAYHGVFHAHITRDEFRLIPIAGAAALIAATCGYVVDVLLNVGSSSLGTLLLTATVTAFSLLAGTVAGRICLGYVWRRGRFRSTVVVAGSGAVTSELALELAHRPELGIDVVACVDPVPHGEVEVSQVIEALRRHRPDRLVIGEVIVTEEALLPAVRLAGTIGTRVYVLPRLFSMGVGNPLFAPDRLRGFPLQRVNRPAHPALALFVKRAIDVLISAGALFVLAPLLFAVGALVKLTSPGPLLFWQERLGQHGQRIRIPKFRSMRMSETSDFEWTAENRVTPIGKFIRRTAIDEIPQLWSVLRGDMSLVGPRPERPAFASQFAEELAEYHSRHRMRVGLTGLAQIAGLRGDTSISERAKYDNLYIDQWSVAGDLIILIRTVGAIVGERRRAQAQRDFEAALANFVDGELDLTSISSLPDASPLPVSSARTSVQA